MSVGLRALSVAIGLVSGCAVCAAPSDFVGSWMVTIEAPGVAPYYARLDIETSNTGQPVAFVENGPAPVLVDGVAIELHVDARDRQGFRFIRVLEGTLDGASMSGTLRTEGILETAAENGENGAPWHAVRAADAVTRDGRTYRKEDFDGTWAPVRGVDVRKYSMLLTDQGARWMSEYDARLDEPQKRCVSPGLVAVATWMFPFEMIVSEKRDRLTLLYEAFSQLRRVHLNDEDPEFYPESSMGYSKGRFIDGELEVETTLLAATTRDFNGEPVGENARVVERYFLTDNGQRLNLIMTLHDPDNYRRPPIRRRVWERNDDAQVLPFECDPDSFFRQLHSEGLMQEYIDRAHMRP